MNVLLHERSCGAAESSMVGEWKVALSEAQHCDQLAKTRKPMRKLMLHIYGGHTAYHDAKAQNRLTLAYKVCSCWTACKATTPV